MAPALPGRNAVEITSSVMCQACPCLPHLSQGCEEQPEFLLGLSARQKFQHGQTGKLEVEWALTDQEENSPCSMWAPRALGGLQGAPLAAYTGLWLQEPLRRSLGHRQNGEICTAHVRKHRIPSLDLGLGRLQDPLHSVLELPRHKAQVEPGTAGFLH